MTDPTDAATHRLRRALDIRDGGPTGPADVAYLRKREDAALVAWTAAVADYDRALRERERVRRRATAAVRRAMNPLQPSYFQRIEECLAGEDWTSLARFDGRNVAHVVATRARVAAARARRDGLTFMADAALASAQASRADVTEQLISVLGLDRAAVVTGVSRRRLSALRTGR